MALAGMAVLSSGCSFLRIAYGTAPDLVYWWLDRYVDFSGEQSTRAHAAIDGAFDWGARTQLPEIAGLLDRARVEISADTTAEKVCAWQPEVQKRLLAVADHLAPAAVDLALTLKPQQLDNIAARYETTNADFRDDYLAPDPKTRAKKAFDRTVDRIESLYGRLDDGQRAMLAERLGRSPFDPERWYAERRANQQDLLAALRRTSAPGASREQALDSYRQFEDRLQHSPRADYQRYSERLNAFNCEFIAALQNSTSAEQRRTAAGNLADWAGDLRSVSSSAKRKNS